MRLKEALLSDTFKRTGWLGYSVHCSVVNESRWEVLWLTTERWPSFHIVDWAWCTLSHKEIFNGMKRDIIDYIYKENNNE
ncbi:hypothetical protein UFOVP1_21 [uncultured Caudovirales phage]|uniref:Uncharacterized protein n=1 Tax=uncultured Caudovirales phage TaxID=2100421 RepID=A0A6J5KHM6_9CAUD|nr:hypothetical protein UFOVP1_21 [uncultured Caudovirales phage]